MRSARGFMLAVLAAALLVRLAPAAENDIGAVKDELPVFDQESAEALTLPGGPNLLANGSFEDGRYWPHPWDPCDKLGTVWADGGTDGRKCIRLDTNILESQWLPWNEQVLGIARKMDEAGAVGTQESATDPIPNPPERLPTKPPYYDTVGGLHGIHYRSEFIWVEPGAIYRISIDARNSGKGDPKLFVKGFFDQTRQAEQGEVVLKRNAWRSEMTLIGCSESWKRYARVMHPARSKSTLNDKPIQPEWLRVEIYAYWPVGTYEFDNVRLEVVGHEPIQRPPATEPGAEAPATGETAAPVKEEEYPVFGR